MTTLFEADQAALAAAGARIRDVPARPSLIDRLTDAELAAGIDGSIEVGRLKPSATTAPDDHG